MAEIGRVRDDIIVGRNPFLYRQTTWIQTSSGAVGVGRFDFSRVCVKAVCPASIVGNRIEGVAE